MNYETALLVFGILLLLIGLVGQVKAKELEVGTSNAVARTVIGVVGAVLIGLSVAASNQILPLLNRADTPSEPEQPQDQGQGDTVQQRANELADIEAKKKQREEELRKLDEELQRREAAAKQADLDDQQKQDAEELKRLRAEKERQEAALARAEDAAGPDRAGQQPLAV